MAPPTVNLLYPPLSGITKFFNSKNPVISWTYQDPELNPQSQIQVEIYKGTSNSLVWDSGAVTITENIDNKSMLSGGLLSLWSEQYYEIPDSADLKYDTTYSLRMRAKDSTGAWSAFTEKALFSIDTTAVTGLMTMPLPDAGAIRLTWGPSDIEGLEGYNVLKYHGPSDSFRKLNKDLIKTTDYTDYTARSGKGEYYRVQVVANGGNVSSSSESVYGMVQYDKWFIEAMALDLVTDQDLKRKRIRTTRNVFGNGRTPRRVVQDKGFLPADISIKFMCLDDEVSTGSDKYDQLLRLLAVPQTFSLRDPFGRQWTVAPGDIDETILKTGSLEYEITLEFTEVS